MEVTQQLFKWGLTGASNHHAHRCGRKEDAQPFARPPVHGTPWENAVLVTWAGGTEGRLIVDLLTPVTCHQPGAHNSIPFHRSPAGLSTHPAGEGLRPSGCPPAEDSCMSGVSPGPPLPFLASCEFRSSHGSLRL